VIKIPSLCLRIRLARAVIFIGSICSIGRSPACQGSFLGRWLIFLAGICALMALGSCSEAPNQESVKPQFDASNWGLVTAPVFGTHESGSYSAAELFAGPNKFGSYYAGVLPNGRIVKPAGVSIQIGMNALGATLTPDGKFLITSDDDEREIVRTGGGTKRGFDSYQASQNTGGYTLCVVDTAAMTVVSEITSNARFFLGLVATGTGPYTVWVSGGPDNDVKLFTVSTGGLISAGSPEKIAIRPILPSDQGYVSNYLPDVSLDTAKGAGDKPPVPTGFNRTAGAQITFPAGSALSPDGKFLYVACNGDNSIAAINTETKQVVKQVPVGFFPYAVSVSRFGDKVFVSNWGITEYKFAKPAYDPATGKLVSIAAAGAGPNQPEGFYVAKSTTGGPNPQTSSVSILDAPGGNGAELSLSRSIYEGHELDELRNVGDTHPSATAMIRSGDLDVIYVAKANSDSLGIITVRNDQNAHKAADEIATVEDYDLSPAPLTLPDGHRVHGSYPNALAASPDGQRLYVAEAGLNSVAVLDLRDPVKPGLLGRIPGGWYPTALAISPNGNSLYIVNAKGIGEDINPRITTGFGIPARTGLASDRDVDSNFIFGSAQKVDLTSVTLDNRAVLANNFAVQQSVDTSVVPAGGAPSGKIKHVFFILHENKTFDSMLGNMSLQFNSFAGVTFNDRDGSTYTNVQNTGVSLNLQALAKAFATAGNYFSDSEESDAGHQFAASGTASDYTEKTLLVKEGRGLLVNKNFEPEDYPEGGYIFNNAARNGVSFKDYGAFVRIAGTDTGSSTPTSLNDPPKGQAGYPQLQADKVSLTNPLENAGDVTSPTKGLGQSYFLKLPVLAVLGGKNQNGEPRLDRDYPGYNFNVSDQRRAQEFIKDFDRMSAAGTLPQFIYIYQPNDHTGEVKAPNAEQIGTSPLQQVADGDVALGMVVNHIMKSPVYYDSSTGLGSAIFITFDDAQSSLDHIHPHRTPLVVVSPFAKPGLALRHYSTASIVKTEELLLGLPPNNLGDLFATDLRDLFQPTYNGITADKVPVTKMATYAPSVEGKRIWTLVRRLDTLAPDRDSHLLGALARLSVRADDLRNQAAKVGGLRTARYQGRQLQLYRIALRMVAEG
jgi:YVTN family beta-propeller protein